MQPGRRPSRRHLAVELIEVVLVVPSGTRNESVQIIAGRIKDTIGEHIGKYTRKYVVTK